MKKKKLVIVIGIMLVVFAFYNVGWYQWKNLKYSEYTEELNDFGNGKSYVLKGEDNYLYNVKVPDYLRYTGNMCVSTSDGKYELIIWPNALKGYEYSVQIQQEEETYGITLKSDLTAKEKEFENVINENADIIQELYNKANVMWNIA